MVNKKMFCLNLFALIYSVFTIGFYISALRYSFVNSYDFLATQYSIPIMIACIISLTVKTVLLFFVKKRVGLFVGLSIIPAAIYNGAFMMFLAFILIWLCFIAVIVLKVMRRDVTNMAIKLAIPLVIVTFAFTLFTANNFVVVTHDTIEAYRSPSGEYAITEETYWSFGKATHRFVRLIQCDSISKFGIIRLIPEDAKNVGITSNDTGEKFDIEWVDDVTYKINGESIPIRNPKP